MSLATHAKQIKGRPPAPENTSLTDVTITLAGSKEADRACALILTPLAAQARQWQAERWYFARGRVGQQIQLKTRFAGPTDTARRLTTFTAALRRQAESELGHPDIEILTRPAMCSTDNSGTSEREAALQYRLGGTEGQELAEEVFELSSDLSLWAVSRFNTEQTRKALLALLLHDAAEAMMYGPRSAAWIDRRRVSWPFFWDTHLDIALRRTAPTSGQTNRIFHRRIASDLHRDHGIMMAAASEQSVYNWRRRWQRSIDQYLYRADKNRVSRCAQQLTLLHIHEMARRLGLGPHAEAAAGIQARHWTKEKERSLLS